MIISIAVFWLTFISVYKNKIRHISVKISNEPKFAKYLFLLSYIIYIALTLLSYRLLGIPVFNENSRLATYTGSGFGFISRISPILYTYSLFYIIHLFCNYNSFHRRIINIILLTPLLIIGVLSGSRSSFLGIVFAFWGYKTFFAQNEPKVKDFKWLIVPFILLSLLTFAIQSSGDITQASLRFLERIISCGDLYWESLPDETWKSVIIKRPFEFTFMGLFGPLRILDTSRAEIPIGFQLTNIIYPAIAGKSTGPVALFPIFGLVCFGYIGGCIFSFFQALLASLLFKATLITSNSIIISALAYNTFNSIIPLIGDISAGLGACLDILVGYMIIAFLLLIIALWLYFKRSLNHLANLV